MLENSNPGLGNRFLCALDLWSALQIIANLMVKKGKGKQTILPELFGMCWTEGLSSY